MRSRDCIASLLFFFLCHAYQRQDISFTLAGPLVLKDGYFMALRHFWLYEAGLGGWLATTVPCQLGWCDLSTKKIFFIFPAHFERPHSAKGPRGPLKRSLTGKKLQEHILTTSSLKL